MRRIYYDYSCEADICLIAIYRRTYIGYWRKFIVIELKSCNKNRYI